MEQSRSELGEIPSPATLSVAWRLRRQGANVIGADLRETTNVGGVRAEQEAVRHL